MVQKEKLQGPEEEINNPFNYWQDKIPCWEMCHCAEELKYQCPAYRNTHSALLGDRGDISKTE